MQPGVDSTKPHSARVYDYYLGGKDHFAADRDTGQRAMQSWPAVRTAVRENRAFLGRAVRYLAAEAGIRQFLDIGAGLPSADNVHEVAQAAAPESRVVYVDNDPIVLAHAQVLLASAPGGRTAYIEAERPSSPRWPSAGWTWSNRAWCWSHSGRPPAGPRPRPDEVNWYGGIGRKTQ